MAYPTPFSDPFAATATRATQIIAALLIAGLAGCSGDGSSNEPRLQVFLKNLPPTSDTTTYELWFKDGDEYLPVTRFDTESGTVSLSLPLTPELTEAATMIVTLEASVIDADEPSDSVLLAGDFIDEEAILSVAHPLSFGTDFSSAYGTYRLDTPTSTQSSDFDQGIWWYDISDGTPIQSLFLPGLPRGWIYEAWVIGPEPPLSIGKFPDPARFDSDLAGALASDAQVAPLFPGQDYISAPELIPGYAALITVEPQPDFSADPFEFEVLIDQVIESINVNQPMDNRTERRLPGGTITRSGGQTS